MLIKNRKRYGNQRQGRIKKEKEMANFLILYEMNSKIEIDPTIHAIRDRHGDSS